MKSRRSSTEQIRLDRIVSLVFDIRVKDFHRPSTKRVSLEPRLVAIYLQKELLKRSYPAIAKYFGKKAHSTCHNAHRSAVALYETDPIFRKKVHECIELYNNYEIDRCKQRYNLHFLIAREGVRVSGPDCTVYLPAEKYESMDGILKERINRLVKKHHYALQLTIE
ncbi:MAG: helix-turn-helix domain-containing protein [Lentimicrobium sp.]